MEQVQTIVKDVISTSETVLNRGLDNVYISTTIKVLIGLYAAFAAPKLPPTLVSLMDNVLVRIGFAFVIVLTATRDPSIALMIAIAFIITLQTANKFRLMGTELSVSAPGQSSWLPSAKNEQFEDEIVGFQNEEDDLDEEGEGVQGGVESPEMSVGSEMSGGSENFSPFFRGKLQEDFEIMQGGNMSGSIESQQPAAFTNMGQLHNSQSNLVDVADQKSCITNLPNQHCAQGLSLNVPEGVTH
tara:strand:+ start:498 stop:1226 length:729 start_codon:yes stop_codon:yes gene_type:complete